MTLRRRIVGLVFVVVLAACEPEGDTVVETAPAPVEAESTTSTSTTTSTTTVARPATTAVPTTRLTATTRAASSCDPNYSGACVPVDSDVDCGGGSGNGPSYVYAKRFRVVGSDIYGLDADHDGIACES